MARQGSYSVDRQTVLLNSLLNITGHLRVTFFLFCAFHTNGLDLRRKSDVLNVHLIHGCKRSDDNPCIARRERFARKCQRADLKPKSIL